MALLYLAIPRQAEAATAISVQSQGVVIERHRHPSVPQCLDRQLMVATADVLHERMAGNDHPGAVVLLEPAHRSQPRLQPAVIAFDMVVGVLLGAMPYGR